MRSLSDRAAGGPRSISLAGVGILAWRLPRPTHSRPAPPRHACDRGRRAGAGTPARADAVRVQSWNLTSATSSGSTQVVGPMQLGGCSANGTCAFLERRDRLRRLPRRPRRRARSRRARRTGARRRPSSRPAARPAPRALPAPGVAADDELRARAALILSHAAERRPGSYAAVLALRDDALEAARRAPRRTALRRRPDACTSCTMRRRQQALREIAAPIDIGVRRRSTPAKCSRSKHMNTTGESLLRLAISLAVLSPARF